MEAKLFAGELRPTPHTTVSPVSAVVWRTCLYRFIGGGLQTTDTQTLLSTQNLKAESECRSKTHGGTHVHVSVLHARHSRFSLSPPLWLRWS